MQKNKKPRYQSAATAIGLSILFMNCVEAKALEETGEFLYGPQISQQAACEAAEKRAINAAIRKINGESITAEEQYSCREESGSGNKKENYQCVLNQNTWSQIDGIVRKIANRKQEVTEQGGATLCKVSVSVELDTPTTKPDANFNFSHEINQKAFRDGEKIRFSIKPSMPMHISVFSYLPYLEGNHQVTKIYPNVYEKNAKISEKLTIPSNNAYELIVNWLDDGNKERNMQDEHFMIVATKDPIKWLDEYSIEKFRSALLEIPADKMRKATGTYVVIKAK